MAFKFTKAQEKSFTELVDAAASANRDLKSFLTDEVLESMRSEFDEKSDKWKEGDVGEKVSAWLEQWDEFAGDLPEFDEWPEMAPE
jgi:hypothetical protein